jgi:hypothetical protein
MDNLSAEHVDEFEMLSPVNINFSIAFNTAIGIIAGRHTARELSQSFLDDHEKTIRSLAGRTKLQHDWAMTFRAARAFDSILGRSSVLGTLGIRELAKIVRGYRDELGGAKKTPRGLWRLLSEYGPALVRQGLPELGRRIRRTRKARATARGEDRDLGDVDFSRFEMAFPARLTLKTIQGETFDAYQVIPFGAPGQERHFETAEEKFRIEAESALSAGEIDQVVDRVRSFEEADLGDLTRRLCLSSDVSPAWARDLRSFLV